MNDVRYCCTCKWFDLNTGVCCGDSEFKAQSRFLDDSCEQWIINMDIYINKGE